MLILLKVSEEMKEDRKDEKTREEEIFVRIGDGVNFTEGVQGDEGAQEG